LDNDPAYTRPYVNSLREEGYHVIPVTTVTEAEDFIEKDRADLFILDVMIPTKTEAEEEYYKPEVTDYGHKTGLIFYHRMKDKLRAANTPVLVMTVRLDKPLTNDFVAEGLPQDRFSTKMALCDTPVFLKKVKQLLGEA